MQRIFVSLICCLGLYCSDIMSEMPPNESEKLSSNLPLLPWTTDIDKALTTSKIDGLPLYVYFTGSSWCVWCKKMDHDIHDNDAFRQKTIGQFHFVKIDLPAGAKPSEKTKDILDTYHVQGVPTIIILSPEGQEVARFRYQHITPSQYANAVLDTARHPTLTK